MDKVTGQCPQTTTFLKEKGEPKRVSNRGPSAYQPNALPLGQTGSRQPNALPPLYSSLYPCLLDERAHPLSRVGRP